MRTIHRAALAALVAVGLGFVAPRNATAQTVQAVQAAGGETPAEQITQASFHTGGGCATCGPAPSYGGGGCSNCGPAPGPFPPPHDNGCGSSCVPGRTDCCGQCDSDGFFGKLYCGIYNAICCPDPCYEPRWVAAANSAFFADAARPVSQVRVRYDAGRDLVLPDRSTYFWNRRGGPGPNLPVVNEVDYDDLTLYSEAAIDRFSFFTEFRYRSIDVDPVFSTGGFGDITLGTKSLLLDSELFQFSFQLKTHLPSGAVNKGLGTGHVALEPGFLAALKLMDDVYIQSELSQWIPIAAGPFGGGVLYHANSLNCVLARPCADAQFIGTLEAFGYHFQSGRFSPPVLPAGANNGLNSGGDDYYSLGAGLRFVMCNRLDIGAGAAISLTDDHFAARLLRTEIRFRY